jgi:hypothetical protein
LLACCAQRGSALVSSLTRTAPRVGLVAYNPVFRRTCLRCTSSTTPSPVAGEVQKGPSNLTLRWITGLSLGAVGTAVIAAGAPVLSPAFLFASYIMREEYYNMVRATGVKTAKNGILAAFLCFATATFYPSLHQMVVPLYTTALMCFLLATNNRSPSISEISTSLMGVLYLGYMPSFWVRVRAIGDPSFALPTMQTMLNPRLWSTGACLMWWTFTSIVFAGELAMPSLLLTQHQSNTISLHNTLSLLSTTALRRWSLLRRQEIRQSEAGDNFASSWARVAQ